MSARGRSAPADTTGQQSLRYWSIGEPADSPFPTPTSAACFDCPIRAAACDHRLINIAAKKRRKKEHERNVVRRGFGKSAARIGTAVTANVTSSLPRPALPWPPWPHWPHWPHWPCSIRLDCRGIHQSPCLNYSDSATRPRLLSQVSTAPQCVL